MKKSNPYFNGFEIVRPNGNVLLFRKRINWTPQDTDTIHIVETDDTLDALASQYYGNVRVDAANYWWLIADANKVMNPLDLSDWVGKSLRIPDIKLLDFAVKR
jgi:nucleoid-associated protein YgaU